MSSDFDPELVCRDENCDREGVHPRHVKVKGFTPKPHRRPKTTRVRCNACGATRLLRRFDDPACPCGGRYVSKPPWQSDDREGLRESVLRAACKPFPVTFQDVLRAVQEDYGRCTERTVYRHLRRVVKDEGKVVKLDVNLGHAAYISPDSRMLRDPTTIKEYLLNRGDEFERYNFSWLASAKRHGAE